MKTIPTPMLTLKESWEELKKQNPKLRIRDAAKELNVSEAELIATGLGENVVRLATDFIDQVKKFPQLGKVMALTRSEGCVLEHKGRFQKIEIHGAGPHQIATVIGPIEQRVFFSGWKYGFAVKSESPRGPLFSFQYFDGQGDAVMKVYIQEESDHEFANKMIAAHGHEDQTSALEPEAMAVQQYTAKEDLDFESFSSDWENMKDTHDFFGMLRKYKLNRLNAVEWIGDKWAYQVDRLSARKIVNIASETELPIMIFAGNKGNIQIHQGKVKNIKQLGNWLNVMDPDFNMHLNEDVVDKVFVVHKNTTDGLVSALELFDKKGDMICQFFGLRKPGIPQKGEWKNLLDSLS
ncbi:ChuX/HutX family heme-like substrate-binding protein [uncultured Cyclobacterium sp.]|uniref:hemin-degrading factor n=1 Tax=uncultured Cyclobacterium sp. TaxID=453820 RepID=UPI0030EC8B3F|tara:strand:- start:273528 stop:274577 length:1050 start_codon:yes stop_codon:yes gene_type:complete